MISMLIKSRTRVRRCTEAYLLPAAAAATCCACCTPFFMQLMYQLRNRSSPASFRSDSVPGL